MRTREVSSTRLRPHSVEGRKGPIKSVRIHWTGTAEGSAEEILAKLEPERGKGGGGVKLKAAVDFLELILSNGPVPVKVIELEAEKNNITEDTLKKAKRELGVDYKKAGMEYVWFIPKPGVTASEVGLEIQGGDLLPVIT